MTYVLVDRRVAGGRHRAVRGRHAYQPKTRGPGVGPRHRVPRRGTATVIAATCVVLALLVLSGWNALSGLADLAVAFE